MHQTHQADGNTSGTWNAKFSPILFRQRETPNNQQHYCLKNRAPTAFQAPQNQGACLYIICYVGLPFLSFGKHIAKPTIDEQSHTKLHWVWFFNQYLKINTELYSDNSDTQHHHPTPCFGFGSLDRQQIAPNDWDGKQRASRNTDCSKGFLHFQENQRLLTLK